MWASVDGEPSLKVRFSSTPEHAAILHHSYAEKEDFNPLLMQESPKKYTPNPDGFGDDCVKDADCTWLDEKIRERCVHKNNSKNTVSDEIETKQCLCSHKRCALKPVLPPEYPEGYCTGRSDCGLEQSTGRCYFEDRIRANQGYYIERGPYCSCIENKCQFRWQDPVPCKKNKDCWFERSNGREYAIPRPKKLRRATFEPGGEGDREPECIDGYCGFGEALWH